MASRKELLTLEYITDDETGNYTIGEIDFGISSETLDKYLQHYGNKGKNEIMSMLGFLMYEIQRRFLLNQPQGQVAVQASLNPPPNPSS